MTIDRLTDAVTKLHDTANTLIEIQNNVDTLQRNLSSIRDDLQRNLSSMKDELEALTDVLEDEFHDVLMNEVIKDDEV